MDRKRLVSWIAVPAMAVGASVLVVAAPAHSAVTAEACSFRDSFKRVERTGAAVLGVSPDTPKAQKKFVDKYDLPFTLVADADKNICNAYGVIQEKNMYGKKVMGMARTTFIIGPDGKIKHIFRKVKPEGHADEVLEYLREAQKGAA